MQRIAEELREESPKPNPGKTKLVETRSEVIAGWHGVADALLAAGQGALAETIWRFIGGMRRLQRVNQDERTVPAGRDCR